MSFSKLIACAIKFILSDFKKKEKSYTLLYYILQGEKTYFSLLQNESICLKWQKFLHSPSPQTNLTLVDAVILMAVFPKGQLREGSSNYFGVIRRQTTYRVLILHQWVMSFINIQI